MPKRPALTRRWLTAATWPVGIALTSWDYMWRTTPMHRREVFPATSPQLPVLPAGVSAEELQGPGDGTGPLFHRRYVTRIRDCRLGADEAEPRSFRLATLAGHLEAGQIVFRVAPDGEQRLMFEIESWARSSSRLVNVLYHRLRMAKEVQAHMWISFLERVVRVSGGRMTCGIELRTERIAGDP